jgi:hypothetical protein
VSWNGATEIKYGWLQSVEDVNAATEEFVTIQELERDGFETSFDLDGVWEANVRIAPLDGKRSVLAYPAVVSASSSIAASDICPIQTLCRTPKLSSANNFFAGVILASQVSRVWFCRIPVLVLEVPARFIKDYMTEEVLETTRFPALEERLAVI